MSYLKSSRLLSGVALLVVATAFAVPAAAGDPYLDRPVPERWFYEPPYLQNDSVDLEWWRSFGDPVLDSLIVRGRESNYDVAQAVTRIEAARAQVGTARSGWYPQIGVSAGWQKERMSGATGPEMVPATTRDYFTAGATMSWEIDVFGKIRQGVRSKEASWRASRLEYEGTMLSVTAEIATAYVDYRAAQAQLAVARDHAESQLKVVKIAEARHETGLASALDVAQAQTVYYSTIATIPTLETSVHVYLNTLATLLGVYAPSLPAGLDQLRYLPVCDTLNLAGVPADLLRRRPDILAAEQNLAAAAAAVGVAKKDFLPTLTLEGTATTSAHRVGNLFKRQSFGFTIAPTLSWTVFSGLARKYAVAEAKAQMESLIDAYNSTVVNAVAETDNAIFSYCRSLDNIESLRLAAENSSKALELAVKLYKSGNTSFTNVADAQISFLNYTNMLISARAQAVASLITLYKAMGGGIPLSAYSD